MAKIENPMTVVQSGGANVPFAEYVYSIAQMFYCRENDMFLGIPETVDLTMFKNARDISQVAGCYSVGAGSQKNYAKHYILNLLNKDEGVAIKGAFSVNTHVETVTFVGGVKSKQPSNSPFAKSPSLKSIFGQIDTNNSNFWDSIGNDAGFNGCVNLEDVEFSYNNSGTLYDVRFADCSKLSDASIVSIANHLKEGASGRSVVFHATPKARCSTLMGTVAMDAGNTYYIFTASASGTTSLEEFITVTKGWTLA